MDSLFLVMQYGEELMVLLIDDEGKWLARPVYVMFGEENLIFGKSVWGGTDGLSVEDLAALHK